MLEGGTVSWTMRIGFGERSTRPTFEDIYDTTLNDSVRWPTSLRPLHFNYYPFQYLAAIYVFILFARIPDLSLSLSHINQHLASCRTSTSTLYPLHGRFLGHTLHIPSRKVYAHRNAPYSLLGLHSYPYKRNNLPVTLIMPSLPSFHGIYGLHSHMFSVHFISTLPRTLSLQPAMYDLSFLC